MLLLLLLLLFFDGLGREERVLAPMFFDLREQLLERLVLVCTNLHVADVLRCEELVDILVRGDGAQGGLRNPPRAVRVDGIVRVVFRGLLLQGARGDEERRVGGRLRARQGGRGPRGGRPKLRKAAAAAGQDQDRTQ